MNKDKKYKNENDYQKEIVNQKNFILETIDIIQKQKLIEIFGKKRNNRKDNDVSSMDVT